MKNKFLVLGRRADRPVQWRRWVWFNVNLRTTPTRVINAVESAVQQAEIDNVARQPAPNCVLMEIDKGCARYALRYWLTDLAIDDPTDGAVRWHIYTALERAGIKLAVEEQNVHYVKDSEKHEEILHQRELALRIRTLRRVELFAQMTEDELHKLAERLRYAPFAKGNTIAKQGAPAQHWLFIIINGDAEVFLEAANGEKRSLNVLSKGDFFGEMSMMTGSPRVATVVAKTDLECYRLDKNAFEEILLARPAIAEEVAHVLVTRRAQLDSALQNLDEETLHREIDHRHNEVLATVRRFFGL
jgi:CRP-like cAMP-binding protein